MAKWRERCARTWLEPLDIKLIELARVLTK